MLKRFPIRRLIPGLSAGIVIGIINVTIGISFATLIFKGDTTPYLPIGIGLILLASVPPLLLVGLFSSYKGIVTVTQNAPAAILTVISAGILSNMSGTASPQEKFLTLLAVEALTCLLTGLLFLVFSRFSLGSLVRFLPYPVVGGFLAGTGWLLVLGGIQVLFNVPLDLAHVGGLFRIEAMLHWLPGVILALIMLLLSNRYRHFLVLPVLLVAILALFYSVIFFGRIPLSTVAGEGWLLGPFGQVSSGQILHISGLTTISWDLILGQAGGITSLVLISLVAFLLNISAIELSIRKDLDINRELRVLGFGNLASGFLGGMVSYHGLADTVINQKIAKGSRLTVWITAGVCLLPLLFGTQFLSLIPKLLLGSLLIFQGFSFLYEWVYQSWAKFTKVEYVVVLVVLLVIAIVGFLQGVAVGIVAALGLFVWNYSRVSVAKHVFSGLERQSRFTRSSHERGVLIEHGNETFILELQGYIFFGTANGLLEKVQRQIDHAASMLRYVVLDFANVIGLDSTALLSFSRMQQVLRDREITLLVCGSSARILKQLMGGGLVPKDSGMAKIFQDLDHGLEWVEDQILKPAAVPRDQQRQVQPFIKLFHEFVPNESNSAQLAKYLEKREIERGDYLMHQDDPPDYIGFIFSGQVTAQLEYPDRPPVRLETMRAERVIGELGFFLGQKRTAAVVADEPTTVFVLTSESLKLMEKEMPDVALHFQQLMIYLLAERTTHLIRTVAALEN